MSWNFYRKEWKQKKRQEHAHLAVYPCKLHILPDHVYNARNPIVMGVMIEAGIVKIGTPLCVPSKEVILLEFYCMQLGIFIICCYLADVRATCGWNI